MNRKKEFHLLKVIISFKDCDRKTLLTNKWLSQYIKNSVILTYAQKITGDDLPSVKAILIS